VQCARRHGVEVRPVEVNASDWDCTLEVVPGGRPALRLGLRLVTGLGAGSGQRLVEARAAGTFASVQDLQERTGLGAADLGALAAANALAAIAGHRYRARWAVAGVEAPLPLFPAIHIAEGLPLLGRPGAGHEVVADYATLGLTLGPHPLSLLRAGLARRGVQPAESLWRLADRELAHVAGIVTTRQRPGSAAGVVFVTIEDETGPANLIVWPALAARQRRPLLEARLLGAWGRVQRQGDVLHVIVLKLVDYSPLLGRLVTRSRDFS
jgi:error-prone DNA polymerase